MKTILTTLACLMLAIVPIYAQFQAGDFFLGGTVGFTRGSETESPNIFRGETEITSFTATIAPRLGYLLSDRFAIGLSLDYGYARENWQASSPQGSGESKFTLHAFSPELFLRRYWPIGERFGGSLDLFARTVFANAKEESASSGDEQLDIFGVSAGLRPGLYYFFSPRLAMEMSLNLFSYEYSKVTEDDAEASTNDGFSADLGARWGGINVGFSYFLNKPAN